MGKGGNKFGKVDEFALDEFVLDVVKPQASSRSLAAHSILENILVIQ